jgi:organic radical activating enzyme
MLPDIYSSNSLYEILVFIKKAVIEISGACNYSCTICPHSVGREKAFVKNMCIHLFMTIIDQLDGVEQVFLEGSGEPTMNKNLPDYIEYAASKGIKVGFITNGSLMTEDLIDRCVGVGVNYIRYSLLGYDQLSYMQAMGRDKFHQVLDSLMYLESTSIPRVGWSGVTTNENDVDLYLQNIHSKLTRAEGELWQPHNWSGGIQSGHQRTGKKRSCGRPSAPDLIVRAGGNDGHSGGVVPCCHVLGKDSQAILGHLDTQTISEVWNGSSYEWLRSHHKNGTYDEVDFCNGCDMLYDAPDSLLWSSYGKDYDSLTGDLFSMEEFRQ